MKFYNKIYASKESKKISKNVYKVGDLVRISKHASTFVRGYLPNYTKAIFKVKTVHKGTPNLYSIEDKTGLLIKGRFYVEEMVKFEGKIFSHLIQRRLINNRYEYLVAYDFHPQQWVSAKIFNEIRKK